MGANAKQPGMSLTGIGLQGMLLFGGMGLAQRCRSRAMPFSATR